MTNTKTIVHLRDGRTVDISGLSAEDAIGKLHALGIDPSQIARTEHQVDGRTFLIHGNNGHKS